MARHGLDVRRRLRPRRAAGRPTKGAATRSQLLARRPAPDRARRLERRARARRACSPAGSAGCAIPDDLALATFDDAYFAELLDPPLTAVGYDPMEVGRARRRRSSSRRCATSDGRPARPHRPRHARRATLLRVHRMSATPPAITPRAASRSATAARPRCATMDLEIAEGEFFCLLGPSGCGKTTTLNLIGGFVGADDRARSCIRDQRVDRLPPHRRSVNTVFQSYALFPHMTVRAERRLRAQDGARQAVGGRRADRGGARASSASRTSATACRASSRAASSSASPSRGRS